MALINCPKCGKQISTYARYCVHCGCNLQDVSSCNLPKQETQEAPKSESKSNLKALYVCIGIIVCVGIFVLINSQNNHVETNSNDSTSENEQVDTPAISGSADMGKTAETSSRDAIVNQIASNMHHVAITTRGDDPYYISQYEVTQHEFETIMGYNPSYFRGPNRPVDSVTYEECQEFIDKLNDIQDIYRYKLPTVDEWTAAALCAYVEYDCPQGWCKDNSDGHTHDVGTSEANNEGLYDMRGNVFEWCKGHIGKGGNYLMAYSYDGINKQVKSRAGYKDKGLGFRLAAYDK